MIVNVSSAPGEVPTYSDAVLTVPSCRLACVPVTEWDGATSAVLPGSQTETLGCDGHACSCSHIVKVQPQPRPSGMRTAVHGHSTGPHEGYRAPAPPSPGTGPCSFQKEQTLQHRSSRLRPQRVSQARGAGARVLLTLTREGTWAALLPVQPPLLALLAWEPKEPCDGGRPGRPPAGPKRPSTPPGAPPRCRRVATPP